MERFFSYGTLQDSNLQQKLIGRKMSGKNDSVSGFRQEEIEIENGIYWILIPDNESVQMVSGQVFEITPAELEAFDVYEGSEYQRSVVTLNGGITAWIYHQ